MKYVIYVSFLLSISLHAGGNKLRDLTGGRGAHADTMRAANLRDAIRKDSEKTVQKAAKMAAEAVAPKGHARKRSLSNNDLQGVRADAGSDSSEEKFDAALEALVRHVQKKKNVDIMLLTMALQKTAVEWKSQQTQQQKNRPSRRASVRSGLEMMQAGAEQQGSNDAQLNRIERMLRAVHSQTVRATSVERHASLSSLPAASVSENGVVLPPPPLAYDTFGADLPLPPPIE